MTIERTFSAERINAIANHPAILPWVSPNADSDRGLDLTAAIADTANIVLDGEHGAMMFAFLQSGLYEVHTMIRPEGRGQWGLSFVRDCLKWMFCQTGAVELMTRVPKGNLAAKALVRAIHGIYQYTHPTGWLKAGSPIPADIYSLTIQDWMRTAPGLEDRGHWFHARLDEEFAKKGRKQPQHPDDAIHDRYVGTAVEMMMGGQLDKAMVFYNRWAAMAGYVPISIVARDPATIDIGNALIVKSGNDFFVPVVRDLN